MLTARSSGRLAGGCAAGCSGAGSAAFFGGFDRFPTPTLLALHERSSTIAAAWPVLDWLSTTAVGAAPTSGEP